ncbi:MAG: rhomboid family intramembrane serine protease [Planctomycetota bacterium]|jgi:membrane associated rhomboid family serine protease
MGLHDRYYYHDNESLDMRPGWDQRSAVSVLIIVNVVIFIANAIFRSPGAGVQGTINELLMLHPGDVFRPWTWWHAISYAFAHDYKQIGHILFNMLGLYMMGRPVEQRYGTSEFYRIYLLSALFCGGLWLVRQAIFGGGASVLGASGAVLCISMLFIFNYPNATVFLLFFPMPAWVMGVILVLVNFFSPAGDGIAYDIHIFGMCFAAMYFFLHWNFSWIQSPSSLWTRVRRWLTGPRLKVVRNREVDNERSDTLEADRILEKIHVFGKDSLTAKEKRFMERYSQAMRDKKKMES